MLGLVEKEWLDTLATINPEEVDYTDYVEAGAAGARELKRNGKQSIGCPQKPIYLFHSVELFSVTIPQRDL